MAEPRRIHALGQHARPGAALDPNTEGLSAFREIQLENQRLKEVIEQAWDDAKLPTFLRYLREYIEKSRKSSGA